LRRPVLTQLVGPMWPLALKGAIHDVVLFGRLLCRKRRRSMDDDEVVSKAHAAGLQVFQGFREQSYRLVFENEDANAGEITIETILPNGHVEMQKTFKPKKGRGIMTFGYPQDIHKNQASRYIRRPEGPGHFIHHEDALDSSAYPLVQTWTVNINDRFRNDFEIMSVDQLQGQIDEGFHTDAIHAFRKSMAKCFSSAEVDKYPIKCCKMKHEKKNEELVVMGPRSNLEGFLKNPDLQKSFFISADAHGFKAWTKPKGKWFPHTQRFEWGPDMDEIYVLYTRVGNSEMTCMMKRQQFTREKTCGNKISPEPGLVQDANSVKKD